MIQCDFCKDWFHGGCVNVKEYQIPDIDKFFCSKCQPQSGPTIHKPKLNWHRHDYSDPDAQRKPSQAGTTAFIRELKQRNFKSGEEVIIRLRGQNLTLPYLQSNGFSRPILVEGKDGLGLAIPQENFTVQDVEHYVGPERMMDVIDVTRQADVRMSLGDFVEYFTKPIRSKVYNVISLEFSDTQLSALVEPPYIARKLCWVNNLWPQDWSVERPEVQRYCLMGVQDSYTDFHIDFGGSSVWYHVLKGEKVFYLVPPTAINLGLYEKWLTANYQHEIFFGDKVESCYKCVVRQGHTLMIPTGWIHAVYTPKDSIVFGGNFLHNLNIALQLQVYGIEKSTQSPLRFRFPFFETIHWFAGERLVEDLKDMNSQGTRCPEHLIVGVRALLLSLKSWSLEKNLINIPQHISVAKLLKDLSRELRHAERNANLTGASSGVPSLKGDNGVPSTTKKVATKRVRKKPNARADFVDINEALSNFAAEEKRLAIKDELKSSAMQSYHSDSDRESPTRPYSSSMPAHMNAVPLKLLLPQRHVIDDDRDGSLVIDEKKLKKPAKVRPHNNQQQRGPIKLRLSVGGKTEYHFAETTEVAAHMDIETGNGIDPSKSGIDHLLRASSVNRSASLEGLDSRGTGRTSPSTREAIVGMLTMSQAFATDGSSDHMGVSLDNSGAPPAPSVAQRQRKGRRRLNASFSDDYGDAVSKVHQDDEYIYPSLDASDDELYGADGAKKKAGRGAKSKRGVLGSHSGDESWNPRARVGPVTPKTDRPIREGAKRPAVERVLEAAAQRRASEPPPKRAYIRRTKSRPSTSSETSMPEPEAGTSTTAGGSEPLQTSPSKIIDGKVSLVKKPKKGMATAKQRLGKILKIHKMVH